METIDIFTLILSIFIFSLLNLVVYIQIKHPSIGVHIHTRKLYNRKYPNKTNVRSQRKNKKK